MGLVREPNPAPRHNVENQAAELLNVDKITYIICRIHLVPLEGSHRGYVGALSLVLGDSQEVLKG
jgi:hypothetical protein